MNKEQMHKMLIEVAAKSPCKKRKVGALIVTWAKENEEDFTPLSSGYNFHPDSESCEDEKGNTREGVLHAEVNAINELKDALNLGTESAYSYLNKRVKMFVTHPPCDGCKAYLKAENIQYEVIGDFLKFDYNKPRMSLVPASLNLEVAKVLTYGARKYKPDNWRKVKSLERYLDALERHLMAYKSGEMVDPESGLSHMSHIACNVAFLIELNDLPLREENF